jgi:CHASE1-domain containing sensor protein
MAIVTIAYTSLVCFLSLVNNYLAFERLTKTILRILQSELVELIHGCTSFRCFAR